MSYICQCELKFQHIAHLFLRTSTIGAIEHCHVDLIAMISAHNWILESLNQIFTWETECSLINLERSDKFQWDWFSLVSRSLINTLINAINELTAFERYVSHNIHLINSHQWCDVWSFSSQCQRKSRKCSRSSSRVFWIPSPTAAMSRVFLPKRRLSPRASHPSTRECPVTVSVLVPRCKLNVGDNSIWKLNMHSR